MAFINMVILIISIIFFVGVTLPSIKKYSDYIYGKPNPIDYVILVGVFIGVWIFLIYMFRVDLTAESATEYQSLYMDMLLKRSKLPIPFFIQQIGIPFLMSQMSLVYIYYPLKCPRVYLKELNNINRFVNFVIYNIEYYQNERTIVRESLDAIEKDSFYNDINYLYEQDMTSKERFEYLTSVYDFKFLYMFLSLFLITLEKGISEEALMSLGTVQQMGNDYFTNMSHLFAAKKGAAYTIFFINTILVIMMLVVRNALGFGYVYFIHDKYPLFLMYLFGTFGLVIVVCLKTKSNKLIYKEGRYV